MKNRCEDFIAAKEWYKIAKEQDNKLAIEILESKFPELKEPEDEKTRKDILSFIKKLDHIYSRDHTDRRSEWIAWLEKQGNLMSALQVANKEIGELVEENYYLKEEQKGKLVLTPEAYERVLKLGEKKTAWSEEDEARFESCINVLQTSDGYDTINTKWLKALKERYCPQKRWKPTEEQIETMKSVLEPYPTLSPREIHNLKELLEQLKKLREE